MCTNFVISKSALVYYQLFNVIIVPFQVFIDVIFYSVIINYHYIDFLPYLKE